MLSPEFYALTMNDFLRDWKACISPSTSNQQGPRLEWNPPPLGKLKWNFDGSANGCPGLTGYGGL